MKPFLLLLARASDKDIARLAALVDHLTFADWDKAIIRTIRREIENDTPGAQLMRRAFRETSARARTRMITNLMSNSPWGVAEARRGRFFQEEGFWPPYTVLISPTMRCNLRCQGCSTGEHPTDMDLPSEVLERLIQECDAMGIRAVTLLGGEPFLREDLWRLYEKYRESIFHVFTNGTLINRERAERIAKLGNLLTVISIDGPQALHDARRGPGAFARAMAAMDHLRNVGAIFGFSATLTRDSLESVISDEFNDLLLARGCLFGWHFPYLPVGRQPDLSRMPTPQQRERLRVHGAARIRATRPLFVMDFMNDSPWVDGCIAAGRRFLHINARGDVEPCVFVHFATDNIKEKSLREALKSPFFRGIRARQPYHPNLLRPCMVLDHPRFFRELLRRYRPYPTHAGALALTQELAAPLERYADEVAEIMDPVWERTHPASSSRSAAAP